MGEEAMQILVAVTACNCKEVESQKDNLANGMYALMCLQFRLNTLDGWEAISYFGWEQKQGKFRLWRLL
jgi:hypothetical protein